MRAPRNRRKGMSLLECILALAIFLMSITGLVFLMGVASDNALEAKMRSQAMSICQSRLAEAGCGALSLEGHDKTACEDDDTYQWSMDVEPGSYGGLFNVTVHVSRKRANGTQLECSLTQMVLDPKLVGTVFDGAKELQTPSTDGTTTDPAASGGSTGGTGAATGASKSGTGAATGGSTSAPSMATPSSGTKAGSTTPSTAPKAGSTTPSTGSKKGG